MSATQGSENWAEQTLSRDFRGLLNQLESNHQRSPPLADDDAHPGNIDDNRRSANISSVKSGSSKTSVVTINNSLPNVPQHRFHSGTGTDVEAAPLATDGLSEDIDRQPATNRSLNPEPLPNHTESASGNREYLPFPVTASNKPSNTMFTDVIGSIVMKLTIRQLYQNFLLRLPSHYFSRVANLFQNAQVSSGDIEDIDREGLFDFDPNDARASVNRLTESWDGFIDCLLREWETLNIVSVLLLSAILTILQIDNAANYHVTRYTAFLSLICALMSLLYGCMFIVRFGSMRKTSRSARWASEWGGAATNIHNQWWNIWVMLAMPATWLCWAIMSFVACIMSFLWHLGTMEVGQSTTPPSPEVSLGPCIAITVVLALGLVYLYLIIIAFKQYGRAIDSWRTRIQQWKRDLPLRYPSAPPPRPHSLADINSFSVNMRYPPPRPRRAYAPAEIFTYPSYPPPHTLVDINTQYPAPSLRAYTLAGTNRSNVDIQLPTSHSSNLRGPLADDNVYAGSLDEKLPEIPLHASPCSSYVSLPNLRLKVMNLGTQLDNSFPSYASTFGLDADTWLRFRTEMNNAWNRPHDILYHPDKYSRDEPLRKPQEYVLEALEEWNITLWTTSGFRAVLCKEYSTSSIVTPYYAIYLLRLISQRSNIAELFGTVPLGLNQIDIHELDTNTPHALVVTSLYPPLTYQTEPLEGENDSIAHESRHAQSAGLEV